MSENEIKAIVEKEGITRTVVGYEHYKGLKKLFILFEPADNPHDEPTMGGAWYIDEATKKMGTMPFSDMLDYTGEIEFISF